jgi:sarcosine oxidase subunit alpha
MEALNVLRIEKGFITHAEIEGRATAADVGMGRMVSQKKDCVGRTMSEREGLSDPERPRLVGLKPVGEIKKLVAGGMLFELEDEVNSANELGHVSSVGYSPEFECWIGLGFVRNGASRHGERIRMVDHMRDIVAEVEICDPVFIDKAGEKARG